MKKTGLFLLAMMAIFIFASCNNDLNSDGTDDSVAKAESNQNDQTEQMLDNSAASLRNSVGMIKNSAAMDVLSSYIGSYSDYTFDAEHQKYMMLGSLIRNQSDSLAADYGLILSFKGTFSVDTLTHRWVYKPSSYIQFNFPNKNGEPCYMKVYVVRDSSNVYNALKLELGRNDSLKAIAIVKCRHLTVSDIDAGNVYYFTRSIYGSKPAEFNFRLSTGGSSDAVNLTLTSDTTSWFGGKSLLTNKFYFDLKVSGLLNLSGRCSNFIKCAANLAIAENNRDNEGIFKRCLANADTLLTTDVYIKLGSSTVSMGKARLLPYQRTVKGDKTKKEWYACLTIVNGKTSFKPFDGVDITEMISFLKEMFG